MKLGIAQLNLTVGDIAGNAAKLLAAANEAHAAGAVLLLTPEMSICGYPAEDLVLRTDFTMACEAALRQLASDAPPNLALVVGYPERSDDGLFNAAALLRGGKGLASDKMAALEAAGVVVSKSPAGLGEAVVEAISRKGK